MAKASKKKSEKSFAKVTFTFEVPTEQALSINKKDAVFCDYTLEDYGWYGAKNIKMSVEVPAVAAQTINLK